MVKANESITSLRQTIDNDVNVGAGDEEHYEKLDVEQLVDLDAKAMEQHIKQDSTFEGKTDIIIYTVGEEGFIYDETLSEWHVITDPGQLASMVGAVENLDLNEMLDSIIDLADQFTVYEESDHYVVRVNELDDDDMMELLEVMGSEIVELLTVTDEQAQIDDFEYEITVDPESSLVDEVYFNMSISIDGDDETLTYQEEQTTEYTDYNEIDEIEIPEEAR